MPRDDIIELAMRYISEDEIVDFPAEDDLFCLVERPVRQQPDSGKEVSNEWQFAGYGICKGYTQDEDARPPGKWVWMHFVALSAFPPAKTALKLQPPHIVKGHFQNQNRSAEIKIVKVNTDAENLVDQPAGSRTQDDESGTTAPPRGKILEFPRKRNE
ncbi:MAG: hypothetical protein GF398_13590 [Chitinivibrionales bacterium]|nr:hypothetical protein [Chitinivibrionales bacterium]